MSVLGASPLAAGVWTGSAADHERVRRFAREFDWSDVSGPIDPEDSAVQIVDALALEIEAAGERMDTGAMHVLLRELEDSAARANARRR